MPNPFEFIRIQEEINQSISDRLDEILDQMLLLTDIIRDSRVDFYGDGK